MNEKDLTFVLRFRNLAKTQIQGFSNQIKKLGLNLTAFQAKLKAVGLSLKKFGLRMITTGRAISTAGNAVREAGTRIATSIGLPLAAVIGFSIKKFADFETAETGLAKTTDASAKKIKELSSRFKELSEEIPFSVETLLRAGEVGSQLGIPVDSLEKFVLVTAKLGIAAEDLDAEMAAFGLTRLTQAAGSGFDNIDRLASVIVELGNNFGTTEGELLNITQRFAATGRVLGMGVDQLLAFGAAAKTVGVRTEAGGTAISKTFTAIASAISKAGPELTEFARVTDLTRGEFQKLAREKPEEAFLRFAQGIKKIEQSGGDVFTTFDILKLSGARVTQTLLSMAGASSVMKDALENANEEWERNTALTIEADKFFATLASRLKVLWNTIGNVAAELGEVFLPYIDVAILKIKEWAGQVREWIKEFKNMSKELQVAKLKWLAFIILIGPATMAIGSFLAVMGFAITGVGILIKSIVLLGASLIKLSKFLLATPWGRFAAVVALAVGALVKFWNTNVQIGEDSFKVSELVREAWILISNHIQATLKVIGGWLETAADWLGLLLPDTDEHFDTWGFIGATIKDVVNLAISSIKTFGLQIGFVLNVATEEFKSWAKKVKNQMSKVGAFWGTLLETKSVSDALDAFNNNFNEVVTDSVQALKDAYDDELEDIWSTDHTGVFLRTIADMAKKTRAERAKLMKGVGRDVVEDVQKGIEEADFTIALPDLPKPPPTWTDAWKDGFVQSLDAMQKDGEAVAKNVEDAFTNAFVSAEEAMLDFLETGEFEWKDFLKNILREFNRVLIKNVLADFAKKIRPKAEDEVKTTVEGTAGAAPTSFLSSMGDLFGGVGGLFSGSAEPTEEYYKNALPALPPDMLETTNTAISEGATATIAALDNQNTVNEGFFSSLGSTFGNLFQSIGGLFSGEGGIGGAVSSGLSTAQSILGLFAKSGYAPGQHGNSFKRLQAQAFASGAKHFSEGGFTSGPDNIPAMLAKNEAVIPLSRNRKIPIEGGGNTVNITVETKDAESFKRSKQQVFAGMSQALRRAQSRGT